LFAVRWPAHLDFPVDYFEFQNLRNVVLCTHL
jgi:hypothetical protein